MYYVYVHMHGCSACAGDTRCLAAIWATSSFCSSGVPPCLDSKAFEPWVGRHVHAHVHVHVPVHAHVHASSYFLSQLLLGINIACEM